MPSINITADIAQAVQKLTDFNTKLDQHNDRLRQATLTAATYNKAGELVRGQLSGWSTDTQKFTATLRQKNNALEVTSIKYANSAQKAREARSAINDLNKAITDVSRSAQYFATYNIFSGFVQGVKDGFNAARDLQIQISLIRTISQDTQQTFAQFNKDIVGVSNRTGLAIEDVSKAFFDTASNQIAKGGAIKSFVEDATNLAKTTGGTVTDAVNLLSSAINAYNIPVSEAANLSALFFKTIDEGRVVMSEMANVFGRVAVQGKAVGVNISDLTATIAFLTKQGVLTSDAFTFVTNLLTQLQKPSRELSAFFESIGTKSGTEAIGTFGFVGLIQKLTTEVKAGNAAATDFFKEIRAEKPFEAISNNFDDFKRIAKEFQDVKKLAATFNEAINIRLESPAAKLEIEFNKIRNLFVNNIGQSVVALVAEIVDGGKEISKFFGGSGELAGGLNIIVRLFRDGTIAIIAYRTAMAANVAVTLAFSSAATAAGVSALSFGQKLAVVGAGLRSTLPGLLAIAASFAASSLLFKSDFLTEQKAGITALTEEIRKVKNEAKGLGESVAEDPNKKFLGIAEPRFQAALQALSKVQVQANRELNRIRQDNLASADAVGNAFKTYIDGLNKGIADLNKKTTDAKNTIEQTRNSLIGFRESLDDIIFQTRQNFATDEQKIVLLKNRIGELVAKARSAVGTGDDQKIKEGVQLLEEAARLTQQRFELQTKLNGTAIVSTKSLEFDLNDLLSIRLELQRQIEKSKNNEIRTTEKQIEIEKRRVRDTEDAFKAFSSFSAFDKDGTIDPRFKDKVTGKVRTDEVRAEFDKLSQVLIGLTGKDFNTRLGLEQLLAQRRKDIIAEINAAERVEAIETAKTKVLLAKRELEDRLATLRKEFEEKAKLNASFQEKLKEQQQPLEELSKAVADTIGKRFFNIKNILPDALARQVPNEGIFIDQSEALKKAFSDEGQLKFFVDRYKKALEDLNKNAINVGGVLIPKEEDIAKTESAIRQLLNKLKEAYKPVADKLGTTPENLLLPGTNVSIKEYEAAISLVIKNLQKNFGELRQNYTQQERIKADALINLFPDLDKVAGQFGTVDAASENTKQKIRQDFSDITTSIQGATTALQNFLNLMQQVPAGKGGQIAADLGEAEYFAEGGVVGQFPGRPRGQDRYPVWAAKDEYIVNAESSRAFRDVLHHINAQRFPQYMNQGGSITGDTVTIGDINIVVNDSGSPNATAMATAKQLERQLRRNNIQLSRRK